MSCINAKLLSIDSFTKLLLFSESAGYCQNPECNKPLFLDSSNKKFHIAEMAHITAAGGNGPRPDKKKSQKERNEFKNLILLCPNCHTIVDKAPNDYGIEVMERWKLDHKKLISEVFNVPLYQSRQEAHMAVSELFEENFQFL